MIIGISGLIGSGKNAVADHLVNQHNFRADSFAKSLKDAVADIFNWDRELLEGKTDASREWREKIDEAWSDRMNRSVTPRWVLQYFGTEVCRKQFHDDIWINSLFARVKQGDRVVISDVRFVNELKMIRKNGGKTVLITRGPIPTKQEMIRRKIHQSEWDWIGFDFDHIINNNGTLDDLHHNTTHLIKSLGLDH
jgi:hypothetical protein